MKSLINNIPFQKRGGKNIRNIVWVHKIRLRVYHNMYNRHLRANLHANIAHHIIYFRPSVQNSFELRWCRRRK